MALELIAIIFMVIGFTAIIYIHHTAKKQLAKEVGNICKTHIIPLTKEALPHTRRLIAKMIRYRRREGLGKKDDVEIIGSEEEVVDSMNKIHYSYFLLLTKIGNVLVSKDPLVSSNLAKETAVIIEKFEFISIRILKKIESGEMYFKSSKAVNNTLLA